MDVRSVYKVKLKFLDSLWKNRELILRLTEREVNGRYRGSLIGLGWSFLQPLAMLAVYTFVFSQVFKARWGSIDEIGPLGFGLNLFAGLLVFNAFAECMARSPSLVLENSNYVKRVMFPLEVLGAVTVGTAIFHAITSLIILSVFRLAILHSVPITFLWIPLVWLPLTMLCLALTWFLSAAGVFLRDIGQAIGIATSMLMFLSPIFFPLSALPLRWQPLLQLNPLAHVIEATRMVTIKGQAPSLAYLVIGSIISILFCELCFRSFQKLKPAFADVI